MESEVLLQPLRILPGWKIGWNTFFEVDPTVENVNAGFFGGSSLFHATNKQLRLSVDLEWRPEDDPDGEYILSVEYAPWERNQKGRRLKSKSIDFRDAKVVYKFKTRNRKAIVKELELIFYGKDEWREDN